MKTLRMYWLIALPLCGLVLGFARPALPPPDLVITNARLIDGTGAIHDRVDILIAKGRIQAILPVDGQTLPPFPALIGKEARLQSRTPQPVLHVGGITIDATGKTVMPGLIDAHVHLLDFGMVVDEASLDEYMATVLPKKLSDFLSAGVTTIKSLADPEDAILDIRDRLAKGRLLGPRLFVVGPSMVAAGEPLAFSLYTRNPWFRARTTAELTTEEAARAMVRRLAAKGVDGLKLVYQDMMYLTIEDDERPYGWVPGRWLTGDILEAIIDEAHRHHLRVTAHTTEEAVALFLVEAGVDGLEHGVTHTRLTDNVLSTRLRDRRVSYVPTLGLYEDDSSIRRDNAMMNLKRLADQGVRIVLGTDTFGEMPAGLTTIHEAELMVQAGLTPHQVIQAATRNAAEHLGQLEHLGTVEPEKQADLIMLDRDPMKDITALRTVEVVVKDGQVVVDRRPRP